MNIIKYVNNAGKKATARAGQGGYDWLHGIGRHAGQKQRLPTPAELDERMYRLGFRRAGLRHNKRHGRK